VNPETSTETASVAAGGNGWFETTHWSVVLEAGQDSAHGADALARLCHIYWYPLYCYVRRSGHPSEDAEDLTQEFFARLLAKDYLKSAAPHKGRFRSFLLLVLKRFLVNEWHREKRVKRGGGREIISLDAQDTENRYLFEPAEEMSPEKLFDYRWAATLLERVMAVLEAEFTAKSDGPPFAELRPFLGGDEDQGSYAELSDRLGLSEGALRVTVYRLRKRYRELLRLEIAHTVDSPEAIDDEIRCLFNALG
jgi:RNA polymerase sigma factor (sigma-70 family)